MIEEAELVRALRAPVAPPVERLVARVMARLDAAPAPRRARWPALALALAAAAVLALYLVPRTDDVTARGGAPSDLARLVGIELYALGGELVPLAPGSAVAPDTAYVAAYRHAGRAPAFALVFAVDSAGDVHWLYPAFTDPASDPLAVALAPSPEPMPQLLAEAVVLDAPAPGPLTLCALVTPAPLRVSDIERAPHSLAALRARWPALRTLTVVVQPR